MPHDARCARRRDTQEAGAERERLDSHENEESRWLLGSDSAVAETSGTPVQEVRQAAWLYLQLVICALLPPATVAWLLLRVMKRSVRLPMPLPCSCSAC